MQRFSAPTTLLQIFGARAWSGGGRGPAPEQDLLVVAALLADVSRGARPCRPLLGDPCICWKEAGGGGVANQTAGCKCNKYTLRIHVD